MARTTHIEVPLHGQIANISCFWAISDVKNCEREKTFRSVNIILDAKFKGDESEVNTSSPKAPKISLDHLTGLHHDADCDGDNSFVGISFFVWCCAVAAETSEGRGRAVKLILPRTDGYLSQSDFLEQRLIQCEGVERVQSFCQPRQYLRSLSAEQVQWGGLYQMLGNAVGGILLNISRHGHAMSEMSELSKIEVDLDNRLSFPWMTRQPITRKMLAYVDGRDRSGTEPLLRAAKTLGIGIIVLGTPGHWLELPEAPHLCDHFVPIDISINASLPMRIVKALNSLDVEIDGLTTNFELYVYPVAEATAFLGLPCESLAAFDICGDKHRQHITSGDPAVRVNKRQNTKSNTADIDTPFPAVVKPCGGTNSEGVSKVQDHGELEAAVDRVFNSQYGHLVDVNAVSVEPYCDGPEIDANFVLQDGDVLFAEFADDFPKAGDREEDGTSTVFKETSMLYPSGLPAAELEMVKKSLHETLLKFGFRSGVFHVEARVQNSNMQYGTCDGVLDLQTAAASSPVTKAPKSFLIEVNPRLPGQMCCTAAHCTYGISYAALHVLIAIGDKERTAAFSQPFCAGPQYWSNAVFIIPDKGGILSSDDIGDELKERRPDLWRSVSSYYCYFEKGQRVPDPTADEEIWLAWFVLHSRVGRRDLLEISERVKAEVRYELL